MPRPNYKDGQTVQYVIPRGQGVVVDGAGRVKALELQANGWWLTVHDRAAGRVVQARPSQVTAKPRRKL